MITFKFGLKGLKAHRILLLAVGVIVLGACSSAPPSRPITSDTLVPGVVVLGVVAKSGLKAPIDTSRLSIDLAALLAGRGNLMITPASVARATIGAGPHDEMLAFYARHGRLAPYQVQRLMAANLPSSRALTVRLESDQVVRMPVARQHVFNSAGTQIPDRERRIYKTIRTTQLSASLLDLRNGQIVWTRQYRVSPETITSANHHTGGSFSASLAASVADTMVHGIDEQHHPEPPKLSASVLALLQEVAYNVPVK